MPLPQSNHARIASAAIDTLPHAHALGKYLTEKAAEEGHDELGRMSWKIIPPTPEALDIIIQAP